MHWIDLGIKAGRVGLVAIMQLAYGQHRVPGFLQSMAPALNLSVIRMRVAPISGVVHPPPGGEGRSGWHTDRRGRVGRLEPCPLARQPVQIRCLDDGMTRTPHGTHLVFVGHDKKKIRGRNGHHLTFSSRL